jgi:NADPH-dependent 2,4-dienoyl-CoA reductase/sulfur reductase-like enzyme
MSVTHHAIDVAIIGGGPAGLAAALKARAEGSSVMILERDHELGGILQQCIHNGFGLRYFKQELTGPEYAQRFIDLVKGTDIQIKLNAMVISITPSLQITAISREGLLKVQAKAIILAMGCRERTRGAINTPGTRPAGIFPAGQAQRFINMEGYFPGKRVLILGSGDIGMIMARRCMLEGIKVLAVAEVLAFPSGLKRNQVQCLDDYGIPLYLRHTITEIRGRERVEGVTIAQVDEKWRPIPGTEKHFDVDTILFSVGLIPENEISVKAGCLLSANGGPNVNENLQTSIPGIFACGNVLQVHDLVDWVSEEAERAGVNAAAYAQGKMNVDETKVFDPIIIRPGNELGYIKPERLDGLTGPKSVQFSFRVRSPRQNIRVQFVSDGKILNDVKKKFVLPSEMIILKTTIKPEDVGASREIVVHVQDENPLVNVIEREMLENEHKSA